MEHLPPGRDARARLGLRAVSELLSSQHQRIGTYAETHRPEPRTPGGALAPQPEAVPGAVVDLLDALPMAAMLVTPVLGDDDGIEDFLYLTQNERARAYVATHVPEDFAPQWTGPVPLFERYPVTGGTALPRMLADAHHERAPQGPAEVEWFIPRRDGPPARLSNEVTVSPCGKDLLVTWEPGHRVRMAKAAQNLVKTCWAEWNLADDTVVPSLGFGHVLGRFATDPVPNLLGMASLLSADSLPAFYRLLYDVLLRTRQSECELRMRGPVNRFIRMVAEPVRPKDGPVWAVRAVLVDVTDDHRRRTLTRAAGEEARRQRGRAEALTEVADALRDAVLPRFQGELASYGLDAVAVYRPDATGSGVGGDWYKARRLPGGRLLVALGDARGHGLDAVTLMAKLRNALAGLAYTDAPVEELTRWLNEVAYDDGIESTATAVIARYHPELSMLRWTCAGHPRPVLLRDGQATQLPPPCGGPGLTLGVLPGATYPAAETVLADGDIVLLFSDGLIERRDSDPDDDMARLLDTAEACAREAAPSPGHEGLQGFAERLLGRLDGPHRADDATLLTLRRVPARKGPEEP